MNDMTTASFRTLGDLLRLHAAEAPDHPAVVMDSQEAVSYRELDLLADRVAAALQRYGVEPGEAIAVPPDQDQFRASLREPLGHGPTQAATAAGD